MILWVFFLLCQSLVVTVPAMAERTGNGSPTPLHFVTWKPDNPNVWDDAIARFESAHPTITIERQIAPHSSTVYHDLLTQKLKNHDSAIDVFFMDVVWPAEFAAAGWVRTLDDRFSQSERGQFLHAAIRAATYRGHIYGVPSRIDSGVFYYRKDLLQQYGFDPPQTWHDLVRQAETILDGERRIHAGLRGYSGQFKQYEGLICGMLEFIESHNGSFLSEDGTRSTLTDSNVMDALSFVRQHIVQRLASPAVLTYQEPESLAIFVQGKAGVSS